ncbi:MAG: hypothetical protein ACK5LK_08550 [Chthoniobacterales bacterium]
MARTQGASRKLRSYELKQGILSVRFSFFLCLIAELFFLLLVAPTHAQNLPRGVQGTSRQIIAFCPDPQLRMRTLSAAERTKRDLLRLLRINDNWKYPLILSFPENKKRAKTPYNTGLYEGDAGSFKVQIDIFDASIVGTATFREALIEALLLEMIYRDSVVRAGRKFELPPAWLVEALLEELRIKTNKAAQIDLAESMIQQEKAPDLRDFLKYSHSPAVMERARRRVGAQALLRTLAGLPERIGGLLRLLRSVPEESDSLELILNTYPSLEKDPERLNKLWNLTLAKMALPARNEVFSARETSKKLEAIVGPPALPAKPLKRDKSKDPRPDVKGALAWSDEAQLPYGRRLLSNHVVALLQLELRSNPVFKPIVEEYREIAQRLIRKPKTRIDKRLSEVASLWMAIDTRLDKVSDYINWFEVNRVKAPNSDFQMMMDFQQEIQETPPRTDAITQHIDLIESSL